MAKKWPPQTCHVCKRPFNAGQWSRGSWKCKPCELAHKEKRRRAKGIKRQAKSFAAKGKPAPIRYRDEWTKAIGHAVKRLSARRRKTGNRDGWSRRCGTAIVSLRIREARSIVESSSKCPKNHFSSMTWERRIKAAQRSMQYDDRIRVELKRDSWLARITNAVNLLGKRHRKGRLRQKT